MSFSRGERRRLERAETKSHARRARLIAKYKPSCPDCGRPFTVDDHVNECRVCKYSVCDACVHFHSAKCRRRH